jgi:Malic enzyme, NAD binding domain
LIQRKPPPPSQALMGGSGQIVHDLLELLPGERGPDFSVRVPVAAETRVSMMNCAEQAYAWTGGRALFAAGSPFGPVKWEGRVFCPGQGNNSSIFPGVGLGLLLAGARRVSDEMFLAAAQALAAQVSAADLEAGRILPVASRMREIAAAAMYRPEYRAA